MKKRVIAITLIVILIFSFSACGVSEEQILSSEYQTTEEISNIESEKVDNIEQVGQDSTDAFSVMEKVNVCERNIPDDKYKNYYEIFPYSFCDSDGDGIGDIDGITSKLDYIDDLGVTAIWLTPICESTTYHKYDVVDYYSIDPQFGTMESFEKFIDECNARGIEVILDLVVNHSSSENKWFKEATQYLRTLGEDEEPSAEQCAYYDYYNFSKNGARGWEQVSGTDWYYECQFWGGMPDLNLDSDAIRNEIVQIVEFWLDKGIAGFRLDATTSYYTANQEKNIEFLTWLNECVKEKNPDAYIVGECWENSVTYSKYYQSGVDSFFDFDFADKNGKIVKLLKGGSALSFGISIVTLQQQIKENNTNAIDAAFTSNHDMGRSAGYYPGDYSEQMIKMAQGIAMMMGGNYFLYYGDELGMKGSGDDENSRAPMQWSSDATYLGMCKSIATKEIDMKYGSLETQIADGNSLYYYVREGLKLRNAYPELARGETTVIEDLSNDEILVMIKEWENSQILVVINPTADIVSIDLSQISLNGREAGDVQIAGTLLTGTDMVEVVDQQVTMQAYSIELFR